MNAFKNAFFNVKKMKMLAKYEPKRKLIFQWWKTFSGTKQICPVWSNKTFSGFKSLKSSNDTKNNVIFTYRQRSKNAGDQVLKLKKRC